MMLKLLNVSSQNMNNGGLMLLDCHCVHMMRTAVLDITRSANIVSHSYTLALCICYVYTGAYNVCCNQYVTLSVS